ncbi:MAG: glycosyltransferase [Lachnospiraceae bacterium]|nr:glycosyltransferase [Lachnospiraceae bacterium]
MKVLILSCSTGGGHNAAGKAVKEQLEYLGHEAVMLDPFSLAGEGVAQKVGAAYIWIASRIPRFFGFLYKLGGMISSSRHKSPVYYANILAVKYLKDYLAKNRFDAIVMPHLYPAEMITCMKRRRMKLPPAIAVATDYTCIPFWEETECDYYIVPHEDLLSENRERGIPSEKMYPYGIPVGLSFSGKADKLRAKAKLHLPADKPVYLVMSGSMGFGKMHLFVFELTRKLTHDEQIIIICGNNKKMQNILKHTYKKNKNVHITGFTDYVAEYMDASDVIFTKPGGLTSTEALVKNIPIVHTAAIPGCETKNREFFVSRGLSLASEHVHTQVSQGITLAENTEIRNAMISTQQKFSKPDASYDIVKLLEKITAD